MVEGLLVPKERAAANVKRIMEAGFPPSYLYMGVRDGCSLLLLFYFFVLMFLCWQGVPVFSWFIHVGNREGVRAMLQAGLDPYTIDVRFFAVYMWHMNAYRVTPLRQGGWPVRSAINEDRLEILGDIVDAGFGFDYESTVRRLRVRVLVTLS